MKSLTPDAEGIVLSLRRPLFLLADLGDEIPPATDPFDFDAEIKAYRSWLPKILSRVPDQHLESLRDAALSNSKTAEDPDTRRAAKRHADMIFEHMVSHGLKSAGIRRRPAEAYTELLALRHVAFMMLAFAPDEMLIEANKSVTVAHLALPDEDKRNRQEEVLYHTLLNESRLYMEVMDKNGTTERFLAKQEGRLH